MCEMECVESQRLRRNVARGDVKAGAHYNTTIRAAEAIQKAIRLSLKAHFHLLKKERKTNDSEKVYIFLINLPVCT